MHHPPGFPPSFSRAAEPSSFAPSTGPRLRTTVRPGPVEGRFTASHPKQNRSSLKPHHLQRGIAALEFALLALFVMVPMFLGIFVFWEVLQTQQVLTRATGDGARQVSRMLHSAKAPKPNGSYPSEAEILATAQVLARDSIRAALGSYLGHSSNVPGDFLTVELSGTGPLTLNVIYARPTLLGSGGGLNFIEPASLQAHSLIQWQ